jgi:hypothetical protein
LIHAVESYYNFTEESTTIKAVLNLVKIYTFYWYITISSINWDQVESPNFKYHEMFMNAVEMTFRIFMHNGNRIYLVCSICKHTSISISLTCLQTSWSSRQIQINIWSQWFFFYSAYILNFQLIGTIWPHDKIRWFLKTLKIKLSSWMLLVLLS